MLRRRGRPGEGGTDANEHPSEGDLRDGLQIKCQTAQCHQRSRQHKGLQ